MSDQDDEGRAELTQEQVALRVCEMSGVPMAQVKLVLESIDRLVEGAAE